jgi:hypothetical protein
MAKAKKPVDCVATRTAKAAGKEPATQAAPAINLFAKAAKKAATEPKKEKGTIIQLPKDLDEAGKLVGDSALLNQAVTDAIVASAEEKAAKTKGTLAKTRLMTYAQGEVVKMNAKLGVLPPTPVSVVNHNGEAITYVMADKSQQNAISVEQVAVLENLLGVDGAAKIVEKRTTVSFNFETMAQEAANAKGKTVFDIVAEVVSGALMADPRLSEDQKESLLLSAEKTFIRIGVVDRAAELCGSDAPRIATFFDAIGSACVRYVKV